MLLSQCRQNWWEDRGCHQGGTTEVFVLQRESCRIFQAEPRLVQLGEDTASGTPSSIPDIGRRGWRRWNQAPVLLGGKLRGRSTSWNTQSSGCRKKTLSSWVRRRGGTAAQGGWTVSITGNISHLDWKNTQAGQSEPTAESALGRAWVWKPPLLLEYVVLWSQCTVILIIFQEMEEHKKVWFILWSKFTQKTNC